jgi:hypothetical protein
MSRSSYRIPTPTWFAFARALPRLEGETESETEARIAAQLQTLDALAPRDRAGAVADPIPPRDLVAAALAPAPAAPPAPAEPDPPPPAWLWRNGHRRNIHEMSDDALREALRELKENAGAMQAGT